MIQFERALLLRYAVNVYPGERTMLACALKGVNHCLLSISIRVAACGLSLALSLSFAQAQAGSGPSQCPELTKFRILGVALEMTKAEWIPATAGSPAQTESSRYTGPMPAYCRAEGI